jgi:trehalose 6-phosphate synthase/phosphatase
MPREERLERWKSNYIYISVHTAQMWADHFIAELNETCATTLKCNTLHPANLQIADVARVFSVAERRLVVLGYNPAGVVPSSGVRRGYGGLQHVRHCKARCAAS